MEELENFKAMWLELNEKISALEAENRNLARKVVNEKFRSAKEKLIRKYNAFIFVEVIMILFIFPFFMYNPFVVEKFRIFACVYWLVFFLFEVSMDFWLKEGIKNIDIYNSSVKEISLQVAKIRKLHKLAVIIGFPVAIGACVLFALAVNADKFTIYGMIVGGIIGGVIGIFQLKSFFQYYRFLQSSEE